MSNHTGMAVDYIEVEESDEEGAGGAAGEGTKTADGPEPSVASVTQSVASSSLLDSAQSGSGTGPQRQELRISPLMGPASGSAMLLDASSATRNEVDPGPFAGPGETNGGGAARLGPERRPDPVEIYTGPQPGSDKPLNLSSGVDSSHIRQQHLNLKRQWESDEEDSEGEERQERQEERQEFRTGLVYSSLMMLHTVPDLPDSDSLTGRNDVHPEQPDRISRIFDALKRGGCVARMKRVPIRGVNKEEVMLVHDKGVWDGILRTAFFTNTELVYQSNALDGRFSLYINEHSAQCARLSCGGVIEMCDAVVSGKVRNGFALVRPPGHHAEPSRSMGFCLFNNVAVAARLMKEKYKEECRRVLILDWDVHHGNGTQSCFYEDEDVLYISIHRYEDASFFPCLEAGNYDQVGEGKGRGRNVNIPWKDKGMTDADYIAAFQRIVMPIAREFAPDFVIISAGFDAAEGDHLGLCHVSPQGYAQMTYDLAGLARGKVVAALEGGYNLDSIAASALSVTEVLLGGVPAPLAAGSSASSIANDTFAEVERVQARYWKSIAKSPYSDLEEEGYDMNRHGFDQLFCLGRLYEFGQRYNLEAFPVSLPGRESSASMFTGQVMCTPGLLEESFDTLVVFAHDAGNVRMGEQDDSLFLRESLGCFVENSSMVVDWVTSKSAGLVDVNVPSQLPTMAKTPISTSMRRGRNPNQSKHPLQLEEARKLLLYVWDNAVAMALHQTPKAKVILIGLGTATDAIMHLIEERDVETYVKGVVQLPAYSLIPTVPKNSGEKRAWYWKNSLVILPHEHAYYTYDAQARSGKRLGKLVRSEEKSAIKVLGREFPTLVAFVEQCLARSPPMSV